MFKYVVLLYNKILSFLTFFIEVEGQLAKINKTVRFFDMSHELDALRVDILKSINERRIEMGYVYLHLLPFFYVYLFSFLVYPIFSWSIE